MDLAADVAAATYELIGLEDEFELVSVDADTDPLTDVKAVGNGV